MRLPAGVSLLLGTLLFLVPGSSLAFVEERGGTTYLDTNSCNDHGGGDFYCNWAIGSKGHIEYATTTSAWGISPASTLYASFYIGIDGATYGSYVTGGQAEVSVSSDGCHFGGSISQAQRDAVAASTLATPVFIENVPLIYAYGSGCGSIGTGTPFTFRFGGGNWNGQISTFTDGSDPSNHAVAYFVITDETPAPPEPDPIIVIPGILGSWEKNGELVIDPVLHTYDDLINTFVLNGFVEGETIFPFPYNWRDSNVLTAAFLRNKINEVQAICECEKVDLIAHSMGGLVARSYIQSDNYGDDVDHLIFIATPHLGSVDSYLVWEGGELVPGPGSSIREFFFFVEAYRDGFSSFFDYVQNKPVSSVQQLLPTFDYLRLDSSGELKHYPNQYPSNTFLDDLNDNVSNLLMSGVELTNFIGNTGDASTISALRVVDSTEPPKWEHGFPKDFGSENTDQGLEYGSGDETVPLASASFVDSNLTELNADHNAIVNASQALAYEVLTGEAPTQISNLGLGGDYFLLLQVLSPVDVQIVAPDGKRLGKDFTTGTEVNEIPGAFYSGFETDNEYLTIPNPLNGEYKVFSQGIDNGGEYTIVTAHASPNGLVQQEAISHILPGDTEEMTVSINNQSPEELAIEDTTTVTYEALLTHIEEAAALGWITDNKFKKVLEATAKQAEKLSGKGQVFAEKALLQVFLVELRAGLKKGKITEDGHGLLTEDVEALLRE